MKLIKKIKKAFPDSKIIVPPKFGVEKVSSLEGPVVFGVIVMLDDLRFTWPNMCCKCGTSTGLIRASSKTILHMKNRPDDMCIEPCRACISHKDKPGSLLVIDYVSNTVSWGSLFSTCEEFIKAVVELNREIFPPPPPWVSFPERSADSKWDQGVEGYFLDRIWYPYWATLSESEKTKILASQPAPHSWELKLNLNNT